MDEATIRSVGFQSEIDRTSCKELLEATGGSKWKNKAFWLEYCEGDDLVKPKVFGVQFNKSESIEKLSLANNNLKGII